MGFIVSSSPHIKDKASLNRIYLMVILALIPSSIAGIYFFRLKAFTILAVSVISAIIIDYIFQKITKRNIGFNGSAILTGLLLGLILPPNIPFWLPIFGNIVAIGLAKYAFGPGNALFNPALTARVFLMISFPILMAGYIAIDGTTSATPLQIMKHPEINSQPGSISTYKSIYIGDIPGSIGETSKILLLLGGLFLIIFNIIDWRIPLGYLASFAILIGVLGKDVIFHLGTGGLFIGAFFMATDYVTSPVTKKGKWIFAISLGIITALLRLYSVYPEGVAFSILLMNGAVPLIDRFTMPKPFGK